MPPLLVDESKSESGRYGSLPRPSIYNYPGEDQGRILGWRCAGPPAVWIGLINEEATNDPTSHDWFP